MERNEKIAALATTALIAGSSIFFAIKAKKFRTEWEQVMDKIVTLEHPVVDNNN